MALNPVGAGTSIALVAAGTVIQNQSGAQTHQSAYLRCVAVDCPVNVAVSMATTAAATPGITSFFIRKDTSETLFIGKPRSNRVVGLTTETNGTTTIDFAEGTGTPFNGGDAVSLTVTGQDYYNFSHKIVNSVNSTSGLNGYYSTRINVDYDYGDDNPGGIQTTFNNAGQVNWAEMRSSFVVGAQSATGLGAQGQGALYIQQVQTSGNA
tara:strand:+ start:1520 stop:2146 length:627 start_codon:yes stop_codon:yes gene_type:complete